MAEPARTAAQRLSPNTLAARLLRFLTWEGRAWRYAPLLGAALIGLDLLWNLTVTESFAIGGYDSVLLALAVLLLLHPWLWPRYEWLTAFALLFLSFVLLLYIVPVLIGNVFFGGFQNLSEGVVTSLVAVPVYGILTLGGIPASLDGVLLTFESQGTGSLTVWIGYYCAGFFSVALVVSAYVSWLLVEFEQINRRLMGFLALGVVLAWVANLIRVTLVILSGHWWGVDELKFVHENLGAPLFFGWMALFFWLVMRFGPSTERPGKLGGRRPESERAL